MTINYDPRADALYIKLADGEFAENREPVEGLVLDVGAGGEILGIEILHASRRYAFSDLSQVNVQLNIPAQTTA